MNIRYGNFAFSGFIFFATVKKDPRSRTERISDRIFSNLFVSVEQIVCDLVELWNVLDVIVERIECASAKLVCFLFIGKRERAEDLVVLNAALHLHITK